MTGPCTNITVVLSTETRDTNKRPMGWWEMSSISATKIWAQAVLYWCRGQSTGRGGREGGGGERGAARGMLGMRSSTKCQERAAVTALKLIV